MIGNRGGVIVVVVVDGTVVDVVVVGGIVEEVVVVVPGTVVDVVVVVPGTVVDVVVVVGGTVVVVGGTVVVVGGTVVVVGGTVVVVGGTVVVVGGTVVDVVVVVAWEPVMPQVTEPMNRSPLALPEPPKPRTSWPALTVREPSGFMTCSLKIHLYVAPVSGLVPTWASLTGGFGPIVIMLVPSRSTPPTIEVDPVRLAPAEHMLDMEAAVNGPANTWPTEHELLTATVHPAIEAVLVTDPAGPVVP